MYKLVVVQANCMYKYIVYVQWKFLSLHIVWYTNKERVIKVKMRKKSENANEIIY